MSSSIERQSNPTAWAAFWFALAGLVLMPIPLFIERCKRLVTMNFNDIVKELVPDAVRQLEVLSGQPTE